MPGNPVLLAFGSESCEAVRIFPLVVLLPLAPVAARTATVSTAERVSHPLHPDPTPRFAWFDEIPVARSSRRNNAKSRLSVLMSGFTTRAKMGVFFFFGGLI